MFGWAKTRAVGGLYDFIGGAIGRAAGTAIVIAILFILTGLLPWQIAVNVLTKPPGWMSSTWFRVGFLIAGLVLIYFSLRFNVWSQKQRAIDSLAEDISWAIDNLLNRPSPVTQSLRSDFDGWCSRVS